MPGNATPIHMQLVKLTPPNDSEAPANSSSSQIV